MSDEGRINRIKILLEGNPHLFWSLFSKESLDRFEMRAPGEELVETFGQFSSGEQIMLKACLDVWFYPCHGYLKACDLWRLDDNNIERFKRAYLDFD